MELQWKSPESLRIWVVKILVTVDMETLGWVSGGYSGGVGSTYAVKLPKIMRISFMV